MRSCLSNDFCCFRASAYTTLDKMVTVFIYNLFIYRSLLVVVVVTVAATVVVSDFFL